eukprot:jgi/Tetstr1/422161/TSEL_013015.t1
MGALIPYNRRLPQPLAGLNCAICDAEHYNILDVSQYTAHMKLSTRLGCSTTSSDSGCKGGARHLAQAQRRRDRREPRHCARALGAQRLPARESAPRSSRVGATGWGRRGNETSHLAAPRPTAQPEHKPPGGNQQDRASGQLGVLGAEGDSTLMPHAAARAVAAGEGGGDEDGGDAERERGRDPGEPALGSAYAGAFRLGRERPMPWDPDSYPLNNHVAPAQAFMYGDVPRRSAKSDLALPLRMVPRRGSAEPNSDPIGRTGCPSAAQTLKLVPEFSTYVFKHYGIDPPGKTLRYVHMGNVIQAPQDRLLVAYQASQLTEGAEDQRIYLSFSLDADVGQRWADPVMLPVKSKGAQWGPVLHLHPRTGDVWLFYTESTNKRFTRPPSENFPQRYTPGGDVMVTKSRDGKAWDKPQKIHSMRAESSSKHGIPKVTANNLLVARTGTWMLPFWRESFFFNQETPCLNHTHDCHGILLSRDEGLTWAARGSIAMPNTHLYEGTVAELGDGSIMMVFRTQLAAAAASKSWDDGETWSEPWLLTADNPDSKPSVINIWPHGEVLMAYNDHTKQNIGCRNCRSKLSISRLVNATGGWDHIAQFGPSPSDYLKVHYPSMRQHGCRLLAVYSSMYTCCAPYNQHCECAPPRCEAGLLLVSFKIWEDKGAAEQMAGHKLAGSAPSVAEGGLWGNQWWSDMERPAEVFRGVLASKGRREHPAAGPPVDRRPDTGSRSSGGGGGLDE